MSKLIGLCGQMGAGKSTVISLLNDMPSISILNIKLAGPLYEMQEFLYRRISSVYERSETFAKDRKLLQFLGSEWGRDSISPTLWVDLWKAEVSSIAKNNLYVNLITCDDVRFDNEAEAVKALGGHVIQIVSTLADKRINAKSGIAGHKSESGVSLEHIDYIIENNGSIDDLRDSLYALNTKLQLW